MQPPLSPLPSARESRVPGFERGPPGNTGFKARLGSIIRSGLGAASAAAPEEPGPDWGRRREGGSLHQGRFDRKPEFLEKLSTIRDLEHSLFCHMYFA